MNPWTEQDATQIQKALATQVPHARVYLSTLGGANRASIIISFSLQPKEKWPNGIFQNSNYAQFSLYGDNKLEFLSGWLMPKFRKAQVKSVQDAIVKLNAYIVKAKDLTVTPETKRPVDIISERITSVEAEQIRAHNLHLLLDPQTKY